MAPPGTVVAGRALALERPITLPVGSVGTAPADPDRGPTDRARG